MITISLLLIQCQSSPAKTKTPLKVKSKLTTPGFIADDEAAKKAAETIWLPIYGNSVLEQKPYNVRLIGDSVWIVEGTLKLQVGGTAYLEMKTDGTVLKVTHGK